MQWQKEIYERKNKEQEKNIRNLLCSHHSKGRKSGHLLVRNHNEGISGLERSWKR